MRQQPHNDKAHKNYHFHLDTDNRPGECDESLLTNSIQTKARRWAFFKLSIYRQPVSHFDAG